MGAQEPPRPASLLGRYVLEPRWRPEHADVVLTVSESSADRWLSTVRRTLPLVPTGVEIDPVAPVPTARAGRPTYPPTLVF